MKKRDNAFSLEQLLEQLIEEEHESIVPYTNAMHTIGDSVINPVLSKIIDGKKQHCALLESSVAELHEQYDLDEAIV
mgnify:CR=1 FL=1